MEVIFFSIIKGATVTKEYSPYFLALPPIASKKPGYLPTLSVSMLAGLHIVFAN